jgi:mannose-1-phosphate guanylyltransferase
MIEATADRLGTLIPPDRQLVLTNHRLVEIIRRLLPQIPPTQVLGEPCKRDTAPCIGLSAALILRQDPEAVMVVMPSDHVIQTDEQFQSALRVAVELVNGSPERLVTFGIPPTYPAEVFGYIERGDRISVPSTTDSDAPTAAYRVRHFREKPKADVAQEYLNSGNFYWNAGIFVWRASTIFERLASFEPEMATRLLAIAASAGTPSFDATFAQEFEAIGGKSIDYAVMEKASDVVVIEAPFQWDDLGGWQALARLRGSDADGNTIDGDVVALRTTNSIIRSEPEHLIAALGVDGLIIVHTQNATLVARRDDEESIRQIVKSLEETGRGEYL